jgi:hypothetical protein
LAAGEDRHLLNNQKVKEMEELLKEILLKLKSKGKECGCEECDPELEEKRKELVKKLSEKFMDKKTDLFETILKIEDDNLKKILATFALAFKF